jgi:DNA-binding FadR family transcriptional regulator
MLGPIGRPPRRERLAQALIDRMRSRIESGDLAVGAQIPTEQQLEQEFGVSRTVVREAITELRAAGLVNSVQGKGVFVCEPQRERLRLTPGEVRNIPETLELLELRLGIESESAAIAAHRRSAAQEGRIREAYEQMAGLVERRQPTVEADFAFHMGVAEATNNRFYTTVLSHFSARAIPRGQFPTLPETGDPLYLAGVLAEHREILEAIGEQDSERARGAMRAHLLASQRRYRHLGGR